MRVVGIGGGHGLAATLRAAREYADEISGVVTVADDGGSSGRLTRELGVPPPGDIRNCLVALAGDVELAEIFQHRFTNGALTGHTAGNLLIAALTEMTGDFGQAVAEAGRFLRCTGRVYPATTQLVELHAHVQGGKVRGQVAVARSARPIQAVHLHPSDPASYGPAVEAILHADQIVMGPGSLFTSLIATLLVPGVRAAVMRSGARRIFVCNARQQKGETLDYSAIQHAEALMAHVGPDAIDTAVVQVPVLENDGVDVEPRGLADLGIELIEADVAGPDGAHDPTSLGAVLRELGPR